MDRCWLSKCVEHRADDLQLPIISTPIYDDLPFRDIMHPIPPPCSFLEDTEMRRWFCIFLLLILGNVRPSDAQSNWDRFRGPNGTGLSDATALPATWTDADYLWKVKLPGVGHASPVIWGKQLIVTSGDPDTAKRLVLCLDSATGATRWQREFDSRTYAQHSSNSYAAATPALDQHGMIVTWTTPESVQVVALDYEGKEVWQRDLGPFIGANGSGASPIIAEGLVIIFNDQDDLRFLSKLNGKEDPGATVGKCAVLALDRQTGETRWELPRDAVLASYATPCIRELPGGEKEVVLASAGHGMTGVDLRTGKVRWEVRDLFPERIVGSPILAGDLAIAGYGRGVHGTEYVAVRCGKNGGNEESSVAYRLKQSVPMVPTPIAANGCVFFWADTGVVTCVDATTGEVHWRDRVGGEFYGSPICVGDRLYAIAKNGDAVVIAAGPSYQLLGRVPLGQDSYATPSVAGGVLYLRTHSQLFALAGSTTD